MSFKLSILSRADSEKICSIFETPPSVPNLAHLVARSARGHSLTLQLGHELLDEGRDAAVGGEQASARRRHGAVQARLCIVRSRWRQCPDGVGGRLNRE